MVQPPRPWPNPPPANHPDFEPAGLAHAEVGKDSLNLFFCADLPPKSAAYKIMAAVVKDDYHSLRQLLADPAHLPDFVNGKGVSPLMVAAARGNVLSLQILAQHPLVNLQRATPAGWTALHYAAHLAQPGAVMTLIKHYADYTCTNKYGEQPFDLAKSTETQEAFWQHKDFTRYMKKLCPAHPRLAPKETAPQNSTAETPPPAADKLRLDFIASAARLALTGQSTIRAKITEEVIKQLDSISPQDFMACCKTLRDAENDVPQAKNGFDWDMLFIAAAKSGRDDLIAPLAKFIQLDDRKTLNEALYQCLRAKDAPDAVAVLLQIGADPKAKAPVAFLNGSKDPIIAFKAFEARRPAAFRQICLWAENLPHWKKNKEHLQHDLRAWKGRGYQANQPDVAAAQEKQMTAAIDLYDQRQKLRGLSLQDMREHLDMALDIKAHNVIAAVYAESQTPHGMRDAAGFAKDTGAHILADILSTGDTATAKRMIRQGYRLEHATRRDALQTIDALQKGQYGTAVQQLTQAHLNGTLTLPDIETMQDRARKLAQIAAMTMPVTGRGGFF